MPPPLLTPHQYRHLEGNYSTKNVAWHIPQVWSVMHFRLVGWENMAKGGGQQWFYGVVSRTSVLHFVVLRELLAWLWNLIECYSLMLLIGSCDECPCSQWACRSCPKSEETDTFLCAQVQYSDLLDTGCKYCKSFDCIIDCLIKI